MARRLLDDVWEPPSPARPAPRQASAEDQGNSVAVSSGPRTAGRAGSSVRVGLVPAAATGRFAPKKLEGDIEGQARSRRKYGRLGTPRTFLLHASREDERMVPTLLRALARHTRRFGISKTIDVLGRKPSETAAPVEGRTTEDWHDREARRWGEIRDGFLGAYKSVTAAELADLTRSGAGNVHARAHSWGKAGKVFAVHDGVKGLYPLFQFKDGKPRPVIGEVLKVLGGKLTPWQVAIWFTSPNGWVGDWRRPVDLLDTEPDRVTEAARKEAMPKVL